MSTKPTHYPDIQLTNQQFYAKCVHIGKTVKTAVRDFLALLPEAEDRQAYLEHYTYPQKLDSMLRYNYEQY